MRTKSLSLFTAVLCLTSCGVRPQEPAGPTVHEVRSVERDGSEKLRAILRIGGGDLNVSGGSAGFLQGDFSYNVPAWKPNVSYSTGKLTVEQPDGKSDFHGDSINKWDLKLNNDVPTDLTVRVGAGESDLNLSSLTLRNLEIEMGAGELKLDLRGKPTQSYDVKIQAGAGETTVRLPHDVGISASTTTGIGEVKAHGLHSEGGKWVNDAYSSAKVQIRLDIKGGVGQINLIAE